MDRDIVFFCLTFDVEPDVGRIGGGMRGIEKGVPALLNLLSNVEWETGKRLFATWFIAHDYWCKVDELYPETLEQMASRGDEIALHAHFGKQRKYFFSESFQRKLLEEGTSALRALGYRVTSFRGGGFYFSGITLKILEELGYLVDSSVMPGLRSAEPQTGFQVNHIACTRLEPYYMNNSNYCMPGDSDLIELPISTTKFFNFSLPPFFIKNSMFRLHLRGSCGRTTGLGHAMKKPEEALKLVRQMLFQKPTHPPKVIVVNFHPWEFFESTPTVNNVSFDHFEKMKEWLTRVAGFENVVFNTLSEAGQVWREKNPRKEPVDQKFLLTLSPSGFGMTVSRRRVDV